MSLTPGARLGPYEVLSALGAGGMGEVYRARDTKLDRDVAIKVLPDTFATDPERIARFQREAKTLASLSHPNISAIYGLEEDKGVTALVLEFVDGPTLADRIAQGPIPVDEALAIARQIADALEAAHENGIIHRDLKPANIKLRPDGTVKVLDFGLAKALGSDASSVANVVLTNSPTITSPIAMTGVGVLLGTAAYMSPEQARGKPVDKRADIWAFGCVLYEMLTGYRPFDGEDASLTLAAIMKSEPDLSALPAGLPSVVRTYLARCLCKDPKQRVRDIGDLRLAFAGSLETAPLAPQVKTLPVPRFWQRPLPAAVAAAFLTAAGGLAVWSLASSNAVSPQPVRRMTITLPDDVMYDGLGLAISPDGRRLVFRATVRGKLQLYSRSLDELEAHPLPGTEWAQYPFFAPDGQSIAFFNVAKGISQTLLQKVPVGGGEPTTIATAPFARGGWWHDDGTITFAGGSMNQSQIFRISSNGGTSSTLATTDLKTFAFGWPQVLPGGKNVLLTAFSTGSPHLAILSVETGESRTIIENAHYGRYVSSGHIAYVSNARLMAVPFDIDRLVTSGPSVSVLDGIQSSGAGVASLAIADEGTLLYRPGTAEILGNAQRGNLVVVTRDGRITKVDASRGSEVWPRLSPDGLQVAVFVGPGSAGSGNTDVWVYDLDRGTREMVTTGPAEDSYFAWTRDGTRIVFLSTRTGAGDLFWQRLDRSSAAEALSTTGTRKVPLSWSPDGKTLAFYELSAKTLRDIWLLTIGGKPEPFLATESDELAPMFSPDGRWLAYVSDETGQREVYVQPYPGPGRRVPVSTGGGEGPQWSHDGRELFYFKRQSVASGELMVVDVKSAPTFVAGVPRVLFGGAFVPQGNGNANYDVFRDGKRFVMIQKPVVDSAEETPLVAVLNWFEDLKRLAPVN